MTSAEFIDFASKIVAIGMGAYGALAAWQVRRYTAVEKVTKAEAARIKAEQDASQRVAEMEKLRHEIERDITAGYLVEIKRMQARLDTQDRRIDAQDREIRSLRTENDLYRRWNALMAAHINANGLVAIPMPE